MKEAKHIERFGKLVDDGDSGDNKRTFVVDDRDEWEDIRIEIDTDDCDRQHALAFKAELIDLWNNRAPAAFVALALTFEILQALKPIGPFFSKLALAVAAQSWPAVLEAIDGLPDIEETTNEKVDALLKQLQELLPGVDRKPAKE